MGSKNDARILVVQNMYAHTFNVTYHPLDLIGIRRCACIQKESVRMVYQSFIKKLLRYVEKYEEVLRKSFRDASMNLCEPSFIPPLLESVCIIALTEKACYNIPEEYLIKHYTALTHDFFDEKEGHFSHALLQNLLQKKETSS